MAEPPQPIRTGKDEPFVKPRRHVDVIDGTFGGGFFGTPCRATVMGDEKGAFFTTNDAVFFVHKRNGAQRLVFDVQRARAPGNAVRTGHQETVIPHGIKRAVVIGDVVKVFLSVSLPCLAQGILDAVSLDQILNNAIPGIGTGNLANASKGSLFVGLGHKNGPLRTDADPRFPVIGDRGCANVGVEVNPGDVIDGPQFPRSVGLIEIITDNRPARAGGDDSTGNPAKTEPVGMDRRHAVLPCPTRRSHHEFVLRTNGKPSFVGIQHVIKLDIIVDTRLFPVDAVGIANLDQALAPHGNETRRVAVPLGKRHVGDIL